VNPAFVRRDEIKSLTGSTDLLSQCIGSLSQETLQETLQSMYA
jgi:hypothetical protein